MTATMPEQPQYTHSIKLEDTAKGIRLSVHVYANSTNDAIERRSQCILRLDKQQWIVKYN